MRTKSSQFCEIENDKEERIGVLAHYFQTFRATSALTCSLAKLPQNSKLKGFQTLKKAEREKKQANCETARARLASYAEPRVSFVQDDGSRVRATEEERQQQITKSKELIKEFCS